MIPSVVIDDLVDRALAEDLAGGDLTTEATIDPAARAVGRAVARTELVVAGGDVFARAFYRLDPGLRVERLLAEGALAKAGDVLWVVEGAAAPILMAERTALNFAQRMCGIATLARRFVTAMPAGSRTRITDTRKTTPGLRALERYAVRCGGAYNHRDNLGSAILIKDNHVAAAGGIQAAVERARRLAPHTCRVEVEVDSLEQLDQALAAAADIVMLDNFSTADVIEGVRRARGKAIVEVSGGVSLDRVHELASAGVDVISVGALTHSVPAADIGLDIERIGA